MKCWWYIYIICGQSLANSKSAMTTVLKAISREKFWHWSEVERSEGWQKAARKIICSGEIARGVGRLQHWGTIAAFFWSEMHRWQDVISRLRTGFCSCMLRLFFMPHELSSLAERIVKTVVRANWARGALCFAVRTTGVDAARDERYPESIQWPTSAREFILTTYKTC